VIDTEAASGSDERTLMRTYDRVLCDAYVAGYDHATQGS
jgi:hypothetical protein